MFIYNNRIQTQHNSSQIMQSERNQALLNLIGKVLHISGIETEAQLRNGVFLAKMANKIPGIMVSIKQSDSESWMEGYELLKTIFVEIEGYLKNSNNFEMPSDISRMNLVQIAKGEDDQALMELLNLIFLVGIQSENKDFFVQKILALDEKYQSELMDVVARYIKQEENNIDEQYEKLQNQLKQIRYTCESLSLENQSLRDSLIAEAEEQKKFKNSLKALQEEHDKLKKELADQLLNNSNKQKSEGSDQSHFQEHYEQTIEQLKQTLMTQEATYTQEIFGLNEKIEEVKEQLEMAQNRVHQLQEESQESSLQIDPSKYINRQQYKKELNEINAKLTEVSSKEWKTKLENIRLLNTIEQLKSKGKKMQEELDKKDAALSASSGNGSLMISEREADKIKLHVLKGIRDTLKSQMEKKNEHRSMKGSALQADSGKNRAKVSNMILDDAEF